MLETLTESNVEIVFEQDNQATITILEAGYSAKLRGANRVHRVNIASIHEQLEQKVLSLDYCMSEDQRANSLTKIMPPMHWPEALNQYRSIVYRSAAMPLTGIVCVCTACTHIPEINVLCAHSDRSFHHVQIEGGVVENHVKQLSMMIAISFCLLRLYIWLKHWSKQVRSAASRCDCIYILKTLT